MLFGVWAPVEDIGVGRESLLPPKVRIVLIRIHQSPSMTQCIITSTALSSRVKSRGQECPPYNLPMISRFGIRGGPVETKRPI